MSEQKDKSPRQIAAAVLTEFKLGRMGQRYAGKILNRYIDQTTRRQQATDLVLGTLRNQIAIDLVIAAAAHIKANKTPARVINIIRVGAYELLYCPKTAEFAIVNEAVNAAKTIAGKKPTGFVNAVLRQISRSIKNRQCDLAKADPKKAIPQSNDSGCELVLDIFADPKEDLTGYLSEAFSLPKWLIKNWITDFGGEKTKQICFASNRRAAIYVRPNALKISAQQLAEKFEAADIALRSLPDENAIKLEAPGPIEKLPGFAEGLFTVQDITASNPVKLLNPQPGSIVADVCAAPGGKATQLAEVMKNSGKVIATDIDSKRLKKVKENCQRLGTSSIEIITFDKLKEQSNNQGGFDAILLDVPCSNTGVLAKRPEARFRLTPAAVSKLTKTQNDLLEMSVAMLKPAGKICYSTCSIQNDENCSLVRNFLKRHKDFELEAEKLTLPTTTEFGCDGGYAAILLKK